MARETDRKNRDATKSEGLIDQYREIGPASLLAALLYMPRSRVTVPAPARRAA